MSDIIGAIFGASKPEPAAAEPAGPSEEELAAQKRLDEIEESKTASEKAKAVKRIRISTARAAGPQTLFTSPGSIPLPVKLGGGRA